MFSVMTRLTVDLLGVKPLCCILLCAEAALLLERVGRGHCL